MAEYASLFRPTRYNWHRHYDPTLGRYIQPDPLGFVDGPSLYAYARSGPTQWVDPEGRYIWWAIPVAFGTANLAWQLYNNDGQLGCVSWGDVAIAALSGLGINRVAWAGISAGKGLGNPFRGKTPAQINEMFRRKGFEPRGPAPASGKGGYVNPRTGRSYHIDEANSFGEPPHVDVNRLRNYGGPLGKKKYFLGD